MLNNRNLILHRVYFESLIGLFTNINSIQKKIKHKNAHKKSHKKILSQQKNTTKVYCFITFTGINDEH